MPSRRDLPPSFDALVAEIEAAISARGHWAAEARILRDAAGRRRLGRAGGTMIADALAARGYELAGEFGHPPSFESEQVIVRRTGGEALETTIEALLPAIRDADRQIPHGIPWRDALVASLALRAWSGRATKDDAS